MRSARPYLVFLLGLISIALWAVPNRPRAGGVAMPDARLESVSYAPFRAWQSPLAGRYPTAAEVEQDLRLIAKHARIIRTYASLEGNFDIGALARRAGLKVWAGIWLDGNPRANAREMAAGIAEANAHPQTVTRVVVGNEVLLRRDLSPAALIRDIDHVRARVTQPVAYADVPEFWFRFPQVAAHVDIVMIHLLPYWENHPVDVDAAVARIGRTIETATRRFPGQRISVGETGWPSRGRWRRDAVPGRVNEAVFLRKFVRLADRDHVDYNIIEAFDQNWKYHEEGIAGANWGIWTAGRRLKFPLAGPVVEMPEWPLYAGISILLSLGLIGLAGARRPRDLVFGFALGNALAYAGAVTAHELYDVSLMICAAANLPAQALLAWLALRRAVAGRKAPVPAGDSAALLRESLFGRARPASWCRDGFDHLWFLFLIAAAIMQAMLALAPRYRDVPFAVLAVPVIVAAWRVLAADLPLCRDWRDWLPGAALAGFACFSAGRAGPLNLEFLVWNALAVVLATPALAAWIGRSARARLAP